MIRTIYVFFEEDGVWYLTEARLFSNDAMGLVFFDGEKWQSTGHGPSSAAEVELGVFQIVTTMRHTSGNEKVRTMDRKLQSTTKSSSTSSTVWQR